MAEKVRLVQQVVEGARLVSEVEDVNAVEAWLGSLPGQAYADVRRAIVSSLNLCHLLPLSSVWAGVQWNRHLDASPLLTTITRGSTPFRLDLFQGDVGHTAVVGPTGAGKSTLLALLTAQWLRYRTAQVFFFDKGRSSRCLTLALGGDFLDLGEQGTIGLQPLADVDDPGERAWAVEWLTDLVARERVAITPEIKTELWAALATLAAQPRHQRTLTVLRALVQTRSGSEALEPFTLQGAFGHLLDAEAVRLGGGRVQAFEMEVLMGQRTAVAPVLTAIFRLFERQLVWTVAGALTGTAWAPSSEAQPVMLDPANLAQTTLTAARELQALLNQVQQFDSETRMLAGLDLDTSGGLDGLLGRIIGLLQQAQGIGYRTVQLDGPYSQGYPATFAGQDWPALQAQAQAWVTANRQTAREAMEEQNATVLAMPGTQARLSTLLDASAAIAMGSAVTGSSCVGSFSSIRAASPPAVVSSPAEYGASFTAASTISIVAGSAWPGVRSGSGSQPEPARSACTFAADSPFLRCSMRRPAQPPLASRTAWRMRTLVTRPRQLRLWEAGLGTGMRSRGFPLMRQVRRTD